MYLQSRTKRWLQALRNSNTQLHSAQATVATFAAAKDQGARVLGEQEHKVMTCLALDYMDLTLESQPLKPGSWLETTLSDVICARQEFAHGDQFVGSLNRLIAPIETAMPILDANAAGCGGCRGADGCWLGHA